MSAPVNVGPIVEVKPRVLKLDEISAELYALHLKDRGCDAVMEPLSPMPGYSTIHIRRL